MAPSRERSTQCRVYKCKSIRHSDLAQIADAITQNPCPICLCEIKPSRAALLPLCKHAFCADCIHKWSDYKRTCPLCKAEFGSWLFIIDLSSQTLEKEKFKSPVDDRPHTVGFPARRRSHLEELRLIRRTRAELTTQYSRTGVIPRRRSFGQLEAANPGVIRERTLQWRASIYERKLQAVPFSSKNRLIEQMEHNNSAKAMVVQRIEPWIKRELEAILDDPNPSVIVHVVTSLFVSGNERSHQASSGEPGARNDFLAPLRPFLHEKSEMFWHELRCFAESPLSLETYDTVAEYISLNQT
ncbi:E3 ubiquitin-protein ligase Topors [Ipomoea triloba]|uniref:E3 ubiquitin-protein ligase Topors n=1 Tax=Ipomoea triloba TaxID=35885 RepID=UPI00125E4787|nr:E3 ubiquitin-protein ligase Topors [Ipomoea triloba]XP_031111041.1 E3 ubiquitin-protein ligase Topors [Ipomoea triloba]